MSHQPQPSYLIVLLILQYYFLFKFTNQNVLCAICPFYPNIYHNHLNGSMSHSSIETCQPKYSISFPSYQFFLHITPILTFTFNHSNNESYKPKCCISFSSYPCELNVPPIWTFLFNYSNDIRWKAQITNLKEQNLLRTLHIWPIPSVLLKSSEVHKLLSSSLCNSLLSTFCEVHWRQQLSSFWGTLKTTVPSCWGTLKKTVPSF